MTLVTLYNDGVDETNSWELGLTKNLSLQRF